MWWSTCSVQLGLASSFLIPQTRLKGYSLRPLSSKSLFRFGHTRIRFENRAKKARGNGHPVETLVRKAEHIIADEEENNIESKENDIEDHAEEHYIDVLIEKPPVFPMKAEPLSSSSYTSMALPPWVWVLVGILIANVLNKILNFVTRPKEAMAEMMMKQMASAMKQQQGMSGVGPGSAYPFGNMSPGFPGSVSPPFDTYASTVNQATTPNQPSSQATQHTEASQFSSRVEKVKEKQETVEKELPKVQPQSSNGSASFFKDIGSINENAVDQESADNAVDFMFEMLKDPTMRESLYQFLPESMRNSETLELVMQSPMVREQFKTMMTPDMIRQMKSFKGSMSDPKLKQQLHSMNVSPDILMKKLMNEPELWNLLQKPNVMQAVMDLQQDPSNMTKYMNDPEVMKVMMKMNELTYQAQREMASGEGQTPIDVHTNPTYPV